MVYVPSEAMPGEVTFSVVVVLASGVKGQYQVFPEFPSSTSAHRHSGQKRNGAVGAVVVGDRQGKGHRCPCFHPVDGVRRKH